MSALHEITRTLNLYGWCYDEDDIDGMAACFTEDAVLLGGAEPTVSATGRSKIRAFFDEKREIRRKARQQTRHVISNVIVENETADTADTLCYLVLAVTEDGGSTSTKAGWYRDKMARTGTAWLIKERTINVDSKYVQRAFKKWRPKTGS